MALAHMGDVANYRRDHDLALINPIGNSTGKVYDGASNNSTGYNKPVKGWTRNNMHAYLCHSGSYSGIRCNQQIINDSVKKWDGQYWLYNLVQTDTRDGKAAAGQGDSGGPAFSHQAGSGYANLIARGVLIGGVDGTQSTCQGVTGRVCYEEMYYMPVGVARNVFGAQVDVD